MMNMDNIIINSVMLKELAVLPPSFTIFFFFNVICTLLIFINCSIRFYKNDFVSARLSFCFVVFIFVFYQVPLVLFSSQVENSLERSWFYSLVVNGGAIIISVWGILSSRLDLVRKSEIHAPLNIINIYIVTIIMAIICLATYMSKVSWDCTGIYALIFDPWLTLLAREFGVKLIGSSIYTYLLGVYANAVAPILILLAVWLIRGSVRSHQTIRGSVLLYRAISGFLGVFGGGAAITAVLVSGTKGLLMPSMLMLVAGCYFWCRTWPSRIFTMLFSIIFVMSSLVFFEQLKERGSVVGGAYDFAACSSKAGTCQQSKELLQSLTARDYSLGLPGKFVKPLQDRLDCLCNGGDTESCASLDLGSSSQIKSLSGTNHLVSSERSINFFNAVLNRMLVVPMQVSVWNFMYAESEQINGLKTLPLSRRLFGDSVNIPELVYQKYGTIYSEGDKTSTSTAPASFFLAYPAFLGVGGFILALFLVLALDLFLAIFSRFVNISLMPMLIGGIMIMCMNFMISDFVTVLISHGGIASFLILAIYTLLIKKKQ